MKKIIKKEDLYIESPPKKTLLMIQMAKDLGYDAYWAGDRSKFGDMSYEEYEMVEMLIDAGWKRKLDE